ncbi:MAG: LEA type 2 family protein [Sulfuriferula multivorans]|uniref:LEA type 2 family protein n=1 Tax=Sulfuriferula multivorans TaxID=1559896 RepID=A0A7C9JVB2_9PROT|nr:LEA type 2 family protein [Sulfuriferula multivorans]
MQRWLILLLAFGFAACSSLPYHAKPPKVSVADVGIKSLGIFEQHFDVGLRVSNPNDFDLTIEALEFELELNGRAFAKGLTRTSALIPAISSTVLRVDAVTQSRNLIQQIKTLPAEPLKEGVPYRIIGRVKTDQSSRWLPFDKQGVYGREDRPARGRAI